MKPILFNTEMVRAILAGRKTVTRRVIKEPWYIEDEEVSRVAGFCMHRGVECTLRAPYPDSIFRTGDILYVRETWCDPGGHGYPILYKADMPMHWDAEDTETGEPVDLKAEDYTWRPSIHMPKDYARLFLRVTDVQVERVQDITDEQARKEGCAARQDFVRVWNDCYAKPRAVKGEDGTIDHYESYPWEDIQETRTYRGKPWYVIGNPWLWVIEFEWVSKEEV